MARYSPEFLAALRYRYEQTDQPMNALAADFEIGITTLQTLVRKNGWTPRSQRMRDCPPSVRLLEEAEALVASLPPPERGSHRRPSAAVLNDKNADAEHRLCGEAVRVGVIDKETPTPTLPLLGGGSEAVPPGGPVPSLPPPAPSVASCLSPAERIEALVVKELEAEEAARAELALRPRSRNEAERCARTLSVLTQTLQTVQKLRAAGGAGSGADEHDDVPEDMDAFRNELARRIRGFVESRVGKERMALNAQFAKLTDDELKELAAAGRERGMGALLEPPPGDADDEVADDTVPNDAVPDDADVE